ncbi:MAG: polysaccharide pyruvyl transferase family protein [Desulfuromonadales bacterium]
MSELRNKDYSMSEVHMNKIFEDVLLAGYYGRQNVGDDCFGVIGTWGARNYWHTETVRLLSHYPLTSTVATVSCLPPRPSFKGQNLLATCYRMLKAGVVVWAGGSTFHSRQVWHAPKALSMAASKIGAVPAGAIGVSLGPYRSIEDEKAVHSQLTSLNFLALRDATSFQEALTLDLPYPPVLASDLAMLLPRIKPTGESRWKEDILGISLCHYERYAGKKIAREEQRENDLLLALTRLLQNGYSGKLRFFIFNGHDRYGDAEITRQFLHKVTPYSRDIEVVPYSADPLDIFNKVAECSFFLTIRLHGCIYAAAANVPCVSIEYHKKCSDFLDDIGVDPQWRVGDLDCGADHLSDLLGRLAGYREDGFYPGRDRLIHLAEQNFLGPVQHYRTKD